MNLCMSTGQLLFYSLIREHLRGWAPPPNGIIKWVLIYRANPCYAGTLVECRADGDFTKEMRTELEAEITVTEQEKPDYSYWEKKVEEIRAIEEIRAWEERLAELRFNPYHDPTNGRFTDSSGGGMGGVLYSKGGKSSYVVNSDLFR